MNRAHRRHLARNKPKCPLCHNVIDAIDMVRFADALLHESCRERFRHAQQVHAEVKARERAQAAGLWLPGDEADA